MIKTEIASSSQSATPLTQDLEEKAPVNAIDAVQAAGSAGKTIGSSPFLRRQWRRRRMLRFAG